MLNDADEWPVRCPYCSHEMRKPIEWLATQERIYCAFCESAFGFKRRVSSSQIENLRKCTSIVANTSIYATKLDNPS